MTVEHRFILSIGLIVACTGAGYLARRSGFLREDLARRLMTLVIVAGYPIVGFLAIWKIHVSIQDIWLPLLGFTQIVIMVLLALAVGRGLFADRLDRGLFALSCSVGNHGATMAGFVIFLLYGEEGLGHSTVYCIYTFVGLVVLNYPLGHHFGSASSGQPLAKLLTRSLLDWRSVGLPACLAAVVLSMLGVARPAEFTDWHIVDVLVYLLIATAYFGVGLRLHMFHLLKLKKIILSVLILRHAGGLAIGMMLFGLTQLTAWPLDGLSGRILLMQSSVPIGVMTVATANMFAIKPREASTLFAVSSFAYLAVGIPIILAIFG